MDHLPLYIPLLFGATTVVTLLIFFRAAQNSYSILALLLSWLLIQTAISLTGFYTQTQILPPRFTLTIVPTIICILILFNNRAGKNLLDHLDLKWLTLLHIIRIPVEIVLFLLFSHNVIPEIMTFEGNNLDILSGLTAPIIYYFVFIKHKFIKFLLLIWNILCLLLLINIVTIAIFSAPYPFQKFGFEQPNVAILYFPYVWLPCCIVPLVLLAHLVAIRRLLYPLAIQDK